MNKRDLLMGFQQCRQEIEALRSENRILNAENRAFNRLLSALEAHTPRNTSTTFSEDILWKIRNTETFLEKEIKDSAPTAMAREE